MSLLHWGSPMFRVLARHNGRGSLKSTGINWNRVTWFSLSSPEIMQALGTSVFIQEMITSCLPRTLPPELVIQLSKAGALPSWVSGVFPTAQRVRGEEQLQ